MSEKRFSYNPFTLDYIGGENTCHAVSLWNKGQELHFDEYIRGIILDDILYLRLYYPFKDLENKTLSELNKTSLILLKDNIKTILQHIKQDYNIPIAEIKYNVTNDLLSGLKLTCI